MKSTTSSAVSASRLEAFCDGVIAIAITLLVLEIKVPNLDNSSASRLLTNLASRGPMFLATVLSFLIIGCYWVNHHRLMRLFRHVDHGFVLLTLLWLLCLCLIPFSTGVLGETILQADSIKTSAPVYLFGLALPATAWALGWHYGVANQLVAPEVSSDVREKLKRIFYLSAAAHSLWVVVSFYAPRLALAIGTFQALSYLRPLELPSGRPPPDL